MYAEKSALKPCSCSSLKPLAERAAGSVLGLPRQVPPRHGVKDRCLFTTCRCHLAHLQDLGFFKVSLLELLSKKNMLLLFAVEQRKRG